MAEQLSFRLEPALPRPGDVAPMWPTPYPEAFDSPDFLFEPTWGGHRVLAFVEPAELAGDGEVRLVDGAGRDLAARLPELAGLAVRVAARSAVLDGELVVVDARGRADDDALRERLAGHPGRPVALLVFDLLHLDGRWLLNQPLDKRRDLLRRVLRPGDEVVMVPAVEGEGRALYDAVAAQGIAGMLARRTDEPVPAGGAERAVAVDRGGARGGRRARTQPAESDRRAAGGGLSPARPRSSRSSAACRSTRTPPGR